MDTGVGNAPYMALTFFSGMGMLSITGLLTSLIAAVLVGVISKGFDSLIRSLIAERKNRWRLEAKRLAAENRQLEARLREQGNDAEQL